MEFIVVMILAGYVFFLAPRCFFVALTKSSKGRREKTQQDRVKYTPESIKDIFIQYWTDQWEDAPTIEAKGDCLVRASKTDGILDQLFTPQPSKTTEAQLIERAENVVSLHRLK